VRRINGSIDNRGWISNPPGSDFPVGLFLLFVMVYVLFLLVAARVIGGGGVVVGGLWNFLID
jgi:hypothetical protein